LAQAQPACPIKDLPTLPTAAPPAPTNLTATVNLGQVGLSWTAAAGASTYNVYRGTTPGGEGATPVATGVIGTLFTDNHATPGTTYYSPASAFTLTRQRA